MTGYEAFREGAALVERVPVGAVAVSGPDAFRFLQDLVSQDLAGLVIGEGDGQGAHSLLLQPTGKLDVDFRVLRVGQEFWLDTEPGWGERLASSLRRFLVRVEVAVEDRSDGWGLVALRGPDAIGVAERAVIPVLGPGFHDDRGIRDQELGRVEVPAALHAHTAWGDVRVVRADWPGLPGVDLVGPRAAVAETVPALVGHGAVPASEADWETVRVECGVPRLGADLDESVIPQEAFLDEVAVSFDKGCFLGQELVCRIHDRGHVNRHLRRLRVTQGGLPPVGAEVLAGDGLAGGKAVGGKTVGAVTSAVESPALGAPVALGYVRREVEPGAGVTLRWSGGEARAVVEAVEHGG